MDDKAVVVCAHHEHTVGGRELAEDFASDAVPGKQLHYLGVGRTMRNQGLRRIGRARLMAELQPAIYNLYTPSHLAVFNDGREMPIQAPTHRAF